MNSASLRIQILYNGRIHTMHPDKPDADAIAITTPLQNSRLGGRILAVGEDSSILSQFGDLAVKKINLQGKAVIPGLVDSHIHLELYAFSLAKVECETSTKDECLRRVAHRAKETPKGLWILGHGWAQSEWTDGFGTASELDSVAPDNPVYLTAKSLHAGWVNSAALALSGINSQTPDPEGGKIDREADGQPTGILFERAMNLVGAQIPKPDVESTISAIRTAQEHLWRLGLTGVHDFDRQRCFTALQELNEAGELSLRVVKSIPVDDLDQAISLGLRSGFGNDILRIGSIKTFSDGALGPKTAAMLEPFSDDPENTGILLLDREELYDIGHQATSHGLSLAVHAIGDKANHEVIAAFEQIRAYENQSGLPQRRHRIEHVQLIHPEDIPKLTRAGVIASMQPIHATSDMVAADQSWGDRSENAYAWQTLQQNGISLTFGSDAPVDSPNPFWGIHAAVTRQRQDGSPGVRGWYPSQRLRTNEAIHSFTVAPAYTAGMEGKLGQLAEGYLADFLILPEDPFTIDPDQLWKIEPLATIIGGDWVYSAMD